LKKEFDPVILPPLREVIARHNLRAEKKLGQNFLLDLNITDKIARAAGDLSGKSVIEIGPGPGGLTRSLLKYGAEKIIAIEYDSRAFEAIKELEEAADKKLRAVQADALTVSPASLAGFRSCMIIGNLPYNIATPLLLRWLAEIRDSPEIYRSLTLLFQKEVAERLLAQPGSKNYGRLTVLTKWLCETRKCFDISPRAFTPAPKVTSTLVHLIPRKCEGHQPEFEAVEDVTAAAFGQRRKMLRTSLKAYTGYFKQAGINPEERAEDLPVEKYIKLASLMRPA
jgi:16S rRNA (adenine1518-N6/adenine1519-N6)-dimethyltransferase